MRKRFSRGCSGYANNGCDNEYCFVFFKDDLTLLAQKKVSQVHGIMNYENSDLQTEEAQTASIECKSQ